MAFNSQQSLFSAPISIPNSLSPTSTSCFHSSRLSTSPNLKKTSSRILYKEGFPLCTLKNTPGCSIERTLIAFHYSTKKLRTSTEALHYPTNRTRRSSPPPTTYHNVHPQIPLHNRRLNIRSRSTLKQRRPPHQNPRSTIQQRFTPRDNHDFWIVGDERQVYVSCWGCECEFGGCAGGRLGPEG